MSQKQGIISVISPKKRDYIKYINVARDYVSHVPIIDIFTLHKNDYLLYQ